MYPWQLQMLEKMYKYKGRGLVQITGRGMDKSFNASQLQKLWDDIVYSPVKDIVLAEAKLHGARYHTAEPVGGNWREMEAWCYEAFGEPGEMWPTQDFAWPECPRWMQNNRKFWFRTEADRMMFVLKWR